MFPSLKTILATTLCWCVLAFPASAGFLNPKTYTLKNGLKVVVVEDHRAPFVDVAVAIGVGSADEMPGKSGLAHFTEHMMFKGVPGAKEGDFNAAIEARGGSFEAFTSLESTVYAETMPKEHIEVALDWEARRLAALDITDDQMERERKVILDELSMRVDGNHHQLAYQNMMSKLLTQHPYRRSVGGYTHEVKTLFRQDVLDFHGKWYVPGNVTLMFSGDIAPEKARDLAEKYFGKIPPREIPQRVRPMEPEPAGETQVRLSFKDKRLKQPSLSYRRVLPAFDDGQLKESEAMSLLPKFLCAPNKGFLWKDLVEKQKIATHMWLHISCLKDYTLVELHVTPSSGIALADLESAVNKSVKEAMDHIYEFASEKTVSRAVTQELAGLVYAKDNLTALASLFATAMASGHSLERIDGGVEALKAVRSKDVIQAAKIIFDTPFYLITQMLPQEAGK
jgi:zinc protease